MGILLDSTVFIKAERRGLGAQEVLAALENAFPDEPKAISVITLLELAHGIERADTVARATSRQTFLEDVLATVTLQPVTPAIAIRAGRLGGRLMKVGIQLSSTDLLIGVTALELRYRVVTDNVRHFSLIPDLEIGYL